MILKLFLDAEGLSPQAFAATIGVSPQTLYRYLSKLRFPTPENLRRIREATKGHVTADDFVDQHTAKPAPLEAA